MYWLREPACTTCLYAAYWQLIYLWNYFELPVSQGITTFSFAVHLVDHIGYYQPPPTFAGVLRILIPLQHSRRVGHRLSHQNPAVQRRQRKLCILCLRSCKPPHPSAPTADKCGQPWIQQKTKRSRKESARSGPLRNRVRHAAHTTMVIIKGTWVTDSISLLLISRTSRMLQYCGGELEPREILTGGISSVAQETLLNGIALRLLGRGGTVFSSTVRCNSSAFYSTWTG